MDGKSNKVIDYTVYSRASGSADKIGNTKTVTLPSIEKLTDTYKGSGVLGEIDLPTYGQFSSMELEIEIGVSDENMDKLLETNSLELRWVVDSIDPSTGKVSVIPHKAFLTVINKSFEEGSLEPGASQDGSYKYEVLAYKRIVNGKEKLNIDKLNGIYAINGVNKLSDISANL